MPIQFEEDKGYAIARAFDIKNRETEEVDIGFAEALPVAFRLENSLGSWAANTPTNQFRYDPEYNPFNIEGELEGYADYASEFVGSHSAEQTQAIKSQIDKEIADRQYLDSAGGSGLAASLIAGTLDPITLASLLVPVGSVVKGAGILGTAARFGAGAGVGTALTEVGLQASQSTRTAEQSGVNILAGTIFGGVLGAGAQTIVGGSLNIPSLARQGHTVSVLPQGLKTRLTKNFGVTEDTPLSEVIGKTRLEAEVKKALSSYNGGELARARKIQEIAQGGVDSIENTSPIFKQILEPLKDFNEAIGKQSVIDAKLGAVTAPDEARRQLIDEVTRDLTNKALPKDVSSANTIGEFLDATEMKAAGLSNTSRMSPLGSNLHSPSANTRLTSLNLAENNFTFKGTEVEGGFVAPISVETKVKAYDKHLYNTQITIDTHLAAAKKAGEFSGLSGRKEFSEQISAALRRGDVSTNTHIQAAVKEIRKTWNELADKYKELGLLPEDIEAKFATSYLSRVYNTEKIIRNRVEFKEFLKTHFQSALTKKGDDLLEELKDALPKKFKVSSDEVEELFKKSETEILASKAPQEVQVKILQAKSQLKADLDKAADSVIDKITSSPAHKSVSLTPTRGGSKGSVPDALKERTLAISDEDLEPWLVSDISVLTDKFVRQAAPEIELTKRFGSTTLDDQIADVNAEYVKILEGLKTKHKGNIPNKVQKGLDNRKRRDLDNIIAMRDRLLGTHASMSDPTNLFIRANRVARQWNFVTKLGGMSVSAIPDLARPVMQHGLRPYSKVTKAYLKNSNEVLKGMSKKELRQMAVGLDYVLSNKNLSRNIAGLDDINTRQNIFEKGLDVAANSLGKLSGMSSWNTHWKSFTGLMVQSRILDAAETVAKGGKLDKPTLTAMQRTGITINDLKAINKQWVKHGDDLDGLKVGRSDLWEDGNITEKFQNAILSDVDSTVVTPGIGDLPKWMDSNFGKIAGQFKSFIFAAQNRMLVSGVQQGDANFVIGSLMSVSLGSLVYITKETLKGREPDYNWNKLIAEGIDRSGLLSIVLESNNAVESLSGNRLGFYSLLGVPPASRFRERGVASALFGPTAGLLDDAKSVAQGTAGALLFGDTISDSQIHSARKLIPYQNLFYMQEVFKTAEDTFKQELN